MLAAINGMTAEYCVIRDAPVQCDHRGRSIVCNPGRVCSCRAPFSLATSSRVCIVSVREEPCHRHEDDAAVMANMISWTGEP